MSDLLKSILVLAILFSCSISAVEIDSSGISFEPPKGFSVLSDELIKIKFPRANPPKIVYSDESTKVSVAVKLTEISMSREHLTELLSSMEASLPRVIPNLIWIKKEIMRFNDVPWMHIEFSSTAIDTDIHNHMYMTSHKGKLVGFNFNATKDTNAQYKDEFKKSFESIQFSE